MEGEDAENTPRWLFFPSSRGSLSWLIGKGRPEVLHPSDVVAESPSHADFLHRLPKAMHLLISSEDVVQMRCLVGARGIS